MKRTLPTNPHPTSVYAFQHPRQAATVIFHVQHKLCYRLSIYQGKMDIEYMTRPRMAD